MGGLADFFSVYYMKNNGKGNKERVSKFLKLNKHVLYLYAFIRHLWKRLTIIRMIFWLFQSINHKHTELRFKTGQDHFRQTRFRRWVNSNHRIQQNGITNGGQFLHGGNITLANFTTRKKCADSNLEVRILCQKIEYGKKFLHNNHSWSHSADWSGQKVS